MGFGHDFGARPLRQLSPPSDDRPAPVVARTGLLVLSGSEPGDTFRGAPRLYFIAMTLQRSWIRRRLGPVIVAVVMGAACSGDSSPVSPEDVSQALTEEIETASIVFRFSAGDAVEAKWQQQYHDWATARLGVSIPGKLHYNKYRDDAQMNAVTGRGCCFAEPEVLSVHTVWSRDNHEVVHVYAARAGSPSNFLSEGLAVAFQVDPALGDFTPRWNGTPLHELARAFRRSGELIPIGNMLTTEEFRSHSSSISYPEAGSFASFLIETRGLDRYLAQFPSSSPNDSASRVRSIFQSALGLSVEQAESEWHVMLDRASGASGD
jgi:hypothetical protein